MIPPLAILGIAQACGLTLFLLLVGGLACFGFDRLSAWRQARNHRRAHARSDARQRQYRANTGRQLRASRRRGKGGSAPQADDPFRRQDRQPGR